MNNDLISMDARHYTSDKLVDIGACWAKQAAASGYTVKVEGGDVTLSMDLPRFDNETADDIIRAMKAHMAWCMPMQDRPDYNDHRLFTSFNMDGTTVAMTKPTINTDFLAGIS